MNQTNLVGQWNNSVVGRVVFSTVGELAIGKSQFGIVLNLVQEDDTSVWCKSSMHNGYTTVSNDIPLSTVGDWCWGGNWPIPTALMRARSVLATSSAMLQQSVKLLGKVCRCYLQRPYFHRSHTYYSIRPVASPCRWLPRSFFRMYRRW